MTAPDTPTSSRRAFLKRGGLAVGSVGLLGSGPAAAQARVSRRMVLPTVDRFEGNYVGQFVIFQSRRDVSPADVPVDGCGFTESWPSEQTRAYDGQLLDRISATPTAVDLPVYVDGSKEPIRSDSTFIVQNTFDCPDGYVGIEGEWVARRSVDGTPLGPTVAGGPSPTPTDAPAPGFGVLAALLGGAGALAGRALGGDDA